MPGIGESLREARMRHRIDVAEVEASTKIRAKYLRALENEEFNLLPGPTFVKSFLKTYAEFLGLDAVLIVEEYRSRHEPAPEVEPQPFGQPPPPPRQRRAPPRPPRGLAIALLVALVLGILAVIGLLGGDGDGDGTDRSASRSETEQRTEQARAERRAQRARERRARERRRRATANGVRLRIVPAEATYVCIDDGQGEVVFEGTLDEPRTFRRERLRLNLGKTSARVTVNGRAVPIDPGPQPVGFDFKAGRREELPEGERPC